MLEILTWPIQVKRHSAPLVVKVSMPQCPHPSISEMLTFLALAIFVGSHRPELPLHNPLKNFGGVYFSPWPETWDDLSFAKISTIPCMKLR